MNRLSIVFSMVFLLVQSCNDYNPFENKDNIDLRVDASRSSIDKRDSISIFSTESLTVYPTVAEQIDSFVVTTKGNRLWSTQSKTIVKPAPGNYPFYFSWNDTGPSSVMVTFYRSDGKSFSRPFEFKLYSPLFQDSIVGEAGAPVRLYTPSLRDGNIIYHWDFGNFADRQVQHESYKSGPDTVTNPTGQCSGIGNLWVSDYNGNSVRSPVAHFTYRFTDSHAPLIAYSESDNIKNDTIITGDSIFALRLIVSDEGGVPNVTINGGTYDDREVTARGDLITKILSGIQKSTKAHPRADTVVATDAAGNSATKIFYIYYSPTGPQTHAVVLQIVNPATMSKVPDTIVPVIYRLYNYSQDTIVMHVSRGTVNKPIDSIMPGSNIRMTWNCPLVIGSNTIEVSAFRHDTILVASEIIVVERTTGNVHNAPSIADIRIDEKEGNSHLTQDNQVVLSFFAIGSDIKSVTVNDKTVTEAKGKPSCYFDTLQVNHELTTISIHAVTTNNLHSDTAVYVRRNALPSLSGSIARRYIIGEKRSDTLSITDADAGDTDSLSIPFFSDSAIAAAFSYKKIGAGKTVVSWKGSGNLHEGEYSLGITLSDNYQSVSLQRMLFYVTKPGAVDIPAYSITHTIDKGIDTLSNGTIDMRAATVPARVEIQIQDKLKAFSKGDSILVENADAVSFSTEPGKFSILINPGNIPMHDTVNIIVKGADGVIDTAGRIPVVNPLISPDSIDRLTYWFALDSNVTKDIVLSGTDTVDMWYNRVNSKQQLFSYTSGREPLLGKQLTPGRKPVLSFGPRKVVFINGVDGGLNAWGDWVSGGYTAFFVAKRQGSIPVGGGALWSSSDYDSTYFALGISKSGKLSVLNHSADADSGSVYESNISLDTSWQIIIYRSNGIPDMESKKSTVEMGLLAVPCESITASADGVSENLMLGSANKHFGNITWPGKIAEALFYKRVLTDEECRDVRSYLYKRHFMTKK